MFPDKVHIQNVSAKQKLVFRIWKIFLIHIPGERKQIAGYTQERMAFSTELCFYFYFCLDRGFSKISAAAALLVRTARNSFAIVLLGTKKWQGPTITSIGDFCSSINELRAHIILKSSVRIMEFTF